MSIFRKLFGNDDVPVSEWKTAMEFYAEKYMGIPEVMTKFDGLWTSEAIVYGRNGRDNARTVVKDADRSVAMAKAQAWIQKQMRDNYAPEVAD